MKEQKNNNFFNDRNSQYLITVILSHLNQV